MKNGPSALFASPFVVAGAIVFSATAPAVSQQRGAGFMMASGAAAYGWRINTVTGAVSYCVRRSDSTDPGYLAETAPVCSKWTDPVQ